MTRPVAVRTVSPPAAAPSERPRPGPVVGTIIALVLAAVAGVVWFVTVGSGTGDLHVEVWDGRAHQSLFAHPVNIGDRFTVEHTHSVTRRLVEETFSVQDGPIVALEELWFDEPGPNLPSGSERIGDTTTTFLREGRAFRVLHHSHPIGAVPLIVGSASVDHVLNFDDGTSLRLLDVAEPGTAVELRVMGRR